MKRIKISTKQGLVLNVDLKDIINLAKGDKVIEVKLIK